jgi:hypothetical protein
VAEIFKEHVEGEGMKLVKEVRAGRHVRFVLLCDEFCCVMSTTV